MLAVLPAGDASKLAPAGRPVATICGVEAPSASSAVTVKEMVLPWSPVASSGAVTTGKHRRGVTRTPAVLLALWPVASRAVKVSVYAPLSAQPGSQVNVPERLSSAKANAPRLCVRSSSG